MCSEANTINFLFSLLKIKGLVVFLALLAHPQEALDKRHLVYCVRVVSVGCTSSTLILVQPTDITRKQYTKFSILKVTTADIKPFHDKNTLNLYHI
jgi:hypothetical protein